MFIMGPTFTSNAIDRVAPNTFVAYTTRVLASLVDRACIARRNHDLRLVNVHSQTLAFHAFLPVRNVINDDALRNNNFETMCLCSAYNTRDDNVIETSDTLWKHNP